MPDRMCRKAYYAMREIHPRSTERTRDEHKLRGWQLRAVVDDDAATDKANDSHHSKGQIGG